MSTTQAVPTSGYAALHSPPKGIRQCDQVAKTTPRTGFGYINATYGRKNSTDRRLHLAALYNLLEQTNHTAKNSLRNENKKRNEATSTAPKHNTPKQTCIQSDSSLTRGSGRPCVAGLATSALASRLTPAALRAPVRPGGGAAPPLEVLASPRRWSTSPGGGINWGGWLSRGRGNAGGLLIY